MLEIYWACLIGGVIFAVVTVVVGDLIGNLFDGILDFLSIEGLHFLQPVVLVSGITAFGGAGILLTEYTSLQVLPAAVLSVIAAILLSVPVYFFYVKPMENTENSTGYSMQDLTGRLGEVTVPIPATGYGEVIMKIGVGNTNQIAASFDREDIQTGTRVVVVEVRDGTLYVSRYEN